MHTYQWDAENRLTSVGQGYTGTFTHNALGLVAERTGSAYGGYMEDSLRDLAGDVLATRDGTNYYSEVRANGRRIASYHNGLTGETYFHHVNMLGSTAVLTNHTGAITQDQLFPNPRITEEHLGFWISAVPLKVEQAQLDTVIDTDRLIVEIGKTL